MKVYIKKSIKREPWELRREEGEKGFNQVLLPRRRAWKAFLFISEYVNSDSNAKDNQESTESITSVQTGFWL